MQAENLPDGLVAVHLGSATELVAVDGTQSLPEAVVSYIQDITPAEPEPMDLSDPNTVVYAGDDLLFELHRISETTGRRATTVFNVGTHDENGAVTGDAWVAQFHSELSELALADQAEGVFGTNSFQPTAEEALAQLEDNIARLEDPSVWEIIPPRP